MGMCGRLGSHANQRNARVVVPPFGTSPLLGVGQNLKIEPGGRGSPRPEALGFLGGPGRGILVGVPCEFAGCKSGEIRVIVHVVIPRPNPEMPPAF